MTERSDPPVLQPKRRRKATPPGHIEVAPASVGQGAQVEAAMSAAGPAQRRTPRKRSAKRAPEAASASVSPASVEETAAIAAGVANDAGRRKPAKSASAAKPNARTAARRAKSATPEATRSNGESPENPSQSFAPTGVVEANVDATGAAATATAAFAPTGIDSGCVDPHVVDASPAMNDDTMSSGLASDRIGADQEETGDSAAEGIVAEAASVESEPVDAAAVEMTADMAIDSSEPAHSSAQDTADGAPSEPPSTDPARRAPDESASDDPPPGPPPPEEPPHHHGWVYLALGVFALALLFGAWGVWNVFFAGGEDDARDAASLARRNDSLRQEVATLRRSDQISREANRDLQRTLAERDEEISGLRADVAFYERFVGATGQRRGLSVHDMEMQLQSEGTWHFVATLTQNLNRGAVNTGRLTVSVEGMRNDRLERLSWTRLRKQNNAPGAAYSFKYFQQVEGDLFLPADFKPVRVTVRLVPAGAAAVEQSFAWAEVLDRSPVP